MFENTVRLIDDYVNIFIHPTKMPEIRWFYGRNYWDLVLDFLNEEYGSVLNNVNGYNPEQWEINFEELPNPLQLQTLISEDLNSHNLGRLKDFIDTVFIDNSYPKLTAAQKYCAFMEADRRSEDSPFITNDSYRYSYSASVHPNYEVTDDLVGFILDYAKDVGCPEECLNIYHAVCEELSVAGADAKSSVSVYKSIEFPSLHDTVSFLLHEMVERGCNLKKCPNCGRYFVPLVRADTTYCGRPSPQMPAKTCQEYRKYMNFLKKTQSDEATRLHRLIYNSRNNKARRCKTADNPIGNPALNAAVEDFVNKSADYRGKVESGAATQAEYIEWLKGVKEMGVL